MGARARLPRKAAALTDQEAGTLSEAGGEPSVPTPSMDFLNLIGRVSAIARGSNSGSSMTPQILRICMPKAAVFPLYDAGNIVGHDLGLRL